MNKVILCGRLTRDPESRMTQASLEVSRFSLACSSDFVSKDGQRETEFINCVAFGRQGEFAEKYLHKGTKIALTGRIQTGSYTNKDGVRVYTTDVVVEEQEFAESKNAQGGSDNGGYVPAQNNAAPVEAGAGFINIPEGIEELPFN